MNLIIDSREIERINEAIENNKKEIEVSLDLNLTKTIVKLTTTGIIYEGKRIITTKIKRYDKCCYILMKNNLQKAQFFVNNNLYKLIPTSKNPILQISGTSMHKKEFVERIIQDKLKGNILDSGTGLGYTSIGLAKTADKITTIEIDKTVIEIAKFNPYSQDLFTNKKIELIIGDLSEEIKKFQNESFDNIILDAGTPRSSGNFFSLNNYKEVYRVLKKHGILYHYIPQHHIKRGRDFTSEITLRLKKAGFEKINRNEKGSYVVCNK
ncbi:methyltransferase domain-containing protein [Candidatus Woesearchaeota archaeon]|nr:methyltransferase domain-containing protein [Candidatus Woesearchaeota archaeon]